MDKTRLAVHGVSWGAYWATKLAIVERQRLRGAQHPIAAHGQVFQRDFLQKSLAWQSRVSVRSNPALMSVLDGVNSLDEMAAFLPRMSLVSQGLLGKPMAPMLVLAGVRDTQVPISDIYLLLNQGDVPKTAWINPQGGHLGRQVKVWPIRGSFSRSLFRGW